MNSLSEAAAVGLEPNAMPAWTRHALYELRDHDILSRQRHTESNARSYPRRIPLVLKRARGIYVEDIEGRVFIDCLAGAGTLALGHNHPVVVDAMQRVIRDELPLHTLDLTTPVKDRFVADLFAMLPPALADNAKVQFCSPAGTDAVEAALKLVRTATGRSTVLAFHGAYHGMSQGALSLMGSTAPKTALGALMSGAQFLPFPYDYRCPFGLGGEAAIAASLNYLETVLTDSHSGVSLPAAVIVEAVQGEGGVIPAPERWLRGVRDITRAAGVALILDEVQTGFGRTGRHFAFEHAGIEPDVVVLSKAVGGSLPLAVVVYQPWLDRWQPGAHAGTFRGNQMAMAAGSATMQFITAQRLTDHAQQMGQRLTAHLRQLQTRHAALGDVRGMGLMIGVEIVDPSAPLDRMGRPPASGELATLIQQQCLRRGLILELGGRSGAVVRFLPPLIVSSQQIDDIASVFCTALDAALQQSPYSAAS